MEQRPILVGRAWGGVPGAWWSSVCPVPIPSPTPKPSDVAARCFHRGDAMGKLLVFLEIRHVLHNFRLDGARLPMESFNANHQSTPVVASPHHDRDARHRRHACWPPRCKQGGQASAPARRAAQHMFVLCHNYWGRGRAASVVCIHVADA
jgi:hypothetical protein